MEEVLKNFGVPPKADRVAVLNSRYSRNALESDATSRYEKKKIGRRVSGRDLA